MAELTTEEKEFLLVLQSVLDEMDTRAVSEAARRMGMEPAKGWDLFRKIQRKATRGTIGRERTSDVHPPRRCPHARAISGVRRTSASMMLERPAPCAPARIGLTGRSPRVHRAVENSSIFLCGPLPHSPPWNKRSHVSAPGCRRSPPQALRTIK